MSKYEILLQVCESGSISKAAQELNYTQSAVSQAVRSFEKEIGAPLFRRYRHGMELLPDTEEILQALQIICREEDHIRRTTLCPARQPSPFQTLTGKTSSCPPTGWTTRPGRSLEAATSVPGSATSSTRISPP